MLQATASSLVSSHHDYANLHFASLSDLEPKGLQHIQKSVAHADVVCSTTNNMFLSPTPPAALSPSWIQSKI